MLAQRPARLLVKWHQLAHCLCVHLPFAQAEPVQAQRARRVVLLLAAVAAVAGARLAVALGVSGVVEPRVMEVVNPRLAVGGHRPMALVVVARLEVVEGLPQLQELAVPVCLAVADLAVAVAGACLQPDPEFPSATGL